MLSKPIRAIRLLTSIVWAWVMDHACSKRIRPKNVSPKTCQQTNPIKTYKGHKAPDIYLIGVGLASFFSEQVRPKNVSPQSCQPTNLIKSYKGHKAPNMYLKGVDVGP